MNKIGKTSIVILSYNTLEFTKLTLLSLKAHEPKIPYEIVVVDQGSTDGSHEWLSKIKWKNFIYHSLSKNLLFSQGNNFGQALCSPDSEYLLLLNSDVQIHKDDWLEERIMPMVEDKTIGATGTGGGCHNYKTGGKFFYDDIMATGKYTDEEFVKKCVSKNRDIIVEITGWSMGTRMDLWEKLGGLRSDKRYEHMWSDTEYCIRLQLMNYKLCLQGYNKKMTHYSGLSHAAIHNPNNYDKRVKNIINDLKNYEEKIKIDH